jgi:hypothetical protein
MPLHDSCPERRNLVTLSSCIIMFYLAGGEFTDHSLRLQIINVSFSKPDALVIGLWLLLFWFCYRYWLVMQGSWVEGFHKEIENDSICKLLLRQHLLKRFKIQELDGAASNEQHRFTLFIYGHYNQDIQFTHIENSVATNTVPCCTLGDKIVIAICGAYLFFRRPSLSTYFIPYLFFICAVAFLINGKP